MSKLKISKKKIAPFGLWLAGIGASFTIILLIVYLLSVAKIYTIPRVEVFNWLLGGSAALSVTSLAVFALLDPQRVRVFLTGRQAKYGSNALIIFLAFLIILILINVLVFQYQGKPIDLTEDRQFSLSSETLDTLETLPEDVQATAFFSSQTPTDTARELLQKYAQNSNGRFVFDFIDQDMNPLAARQAGITGDGKIYLQMGSAHEIVSYASEQEVTSALIRLMNPGDKVIYFLTGHGERDAVNPGDTSMTLAKSALEAKNYSVKLLNLVAENEIPSDVSVLVIAGPLQPFTVKEISLIEEYISKGGSILVMQEPSPLIEMNEKSDLLADYLFTSWGISFIDNIIIDTNSDQPLFAIAASYGTHSITNKLQGLISFFPTARSISVQPVSSLQPIELVATTDSAWGETDYDSLEAGGQVSFSPGTDTLGPLTVSVVTSDPATGGKVIAIGDADFASNTFFNQYANGDLFLNSIDWAVGQEDLMNLSSPSPITRSLILPSSFWLLAMAISFLCLIPGIVIAGGVISWLSRRSKG